MKKLFLTLIICLVSVKEQFSVLHMGIQLIDLFLGRNTGEACGHSRLQAVSVPNLQASPILGLVRQQSAVLHGGHKDPVIPMDRFTMRIWHKYILLR